MVGAGEKHRSPNKKQHDTMENGINIKWDKTWGCINKARHPSRGFTVTTPVCSHDTIVNSTKRYESWIHNERTTLINHLLFMDDLKLYMEVTRTN